MDFNFDPVDVFVATKLIYVATLSLVCLQVLSWPCRDIGFVYAAFGL